MYPLNGLPQLHLVTQEHNVLGTGTHRNQVRQSHLTGLIDKDVVQLLVHFTIREQPSCTRDQSILAVIAKCINDVSVVEDVFDIVTIKIRVKFATCGFLGPLEDEVVLFGDLHYALKQVVNGLVAVR